jgi:hypothetical protein
MQVLSRRPRYRDKDKFPGQSASRATRFSFLFGMDRESKSRGSDRVDDDHDDHATSTDGSVHAGRVPQLLTR